MEVLAALATLQAELTCPICLDYLKDPVTIDCGHNFCGSCIQMSWEDLQDTFPCPVCHHPCPQRCFSVNPQMATLVNMAKLFHSSRREMRPEKKRRCEEHNEDLTLFCEDDQELVCPQNTQPPELQDHHMRLVAEAATDHRHGLSGYNEPLKKQMEEVKKLIVSQDRNLLQLREEVRKQRSQLASEFEFLNQLIENEQEAALSRWVEEEKDFERKLSANLTAISEHISVLKGLRKEVAERSVLSQGMVLKQFKSFKQRCESLEPPVLQTLHFSDKDFHTMPLYLTLRNIIQKFREEVTLDPKTAHPSLCVSEDRKTVNYVQERSKDDGKVRESDDAVVLGSEGYSSGRHYWEVQVGNKTEWAVGVCTDTISGKEQPPLLNQKRSWTIQLQDGNYLAGGSVPVLVSVKNKPQKIGIYLDYELGQISFYDASDRSHIYSLTDTFSDVLKPYFWVGWDSTPLILCEVEIL
ncbi:tripartite motif-containing protein 75-like [Sorex araneus]|uniref:tripartite motif-containing protein 75-like n=1 Tax=Sorex araneus TaxID=42254 RepID=UPI002433B73B|nr:tripartite motif-containing protein 75-like [Sorex araneus]